MHLAFKGHAKNKNPRKPTHACRHTYMHTPAMTQNRRSTLRVETLHFSSKGQQCSGIGRGTMVRPCAKVKLLDNAAIIILKYSTCNLVVLQTSCSWIVLLVTHTMPSFSLKYKTDRVSFHQFWASVSIQNESMLMIILARTHLHMVFLSNAIRSSCNKVIYVVIVWLWSGSTQQLTNETWGQKRWNRRPYQGLSPAGCSRRDI